MLLIAIRNVSENSYSVRKQTLGPVTDESIRFAPPPSKYWLMSALLDFCCSKRKLSLLTVPLWIGWLVVGLKPIVCTRNLGLRREYLWGSRSQRDPSPYLHKIRRKLRKKIRTSRLTNTTEDWTRHLSSTSLSLGQWAVHYGTITVHVLLCSKNQKSYFKLLLLA